MGFLYAWGMDILEKLSSRRKHMRIIIAGTRYFNNYEFLKHHMDRLLVNVKDEIEIVSGGATGADAWGEHYAAEKGYKKKVFLPEWDRYKKAAGPVRNEQ